MDKIKTDLKKLKIATNTQKKMSLREEFIAAGHPAMVFDSLHGKMSEAQLRGIYKF